MLAKNKLWYQKGKVTAVKHAMFVSHHRILQVHLGPTGEEQLYNTSMTTVTGTHEGSPAILRNTMRQNSTISVMNMKRQYKGVYLLLSTNYMRQSITLIWTSCVHISHSLVLQYEFELIIVWSKSDDEEDALMKAVGKCCGTNWRQHGMAPLWDTI